MFYRWIIGALLLPGVLLAQNRKEKSGSLHNSMKPENGQWKISSNAEMTRNGNIIEIISRKGTPKVTKRLPYDFTGAVRYLQIRIISGSGLVLPGTDLGPLPDWLKFQPGMYTIPIFEKTRPDLNGKPMKGIMTFFLRLLPGKLQFSELALVDRNAPDGVFFTVTSPNGKVKDSQTAAVAGDTITIEMQVKDKPDNLSLYLYQVNDGKNWAHRGRFEALTLPDVPIELKATDTPNRYRASFKLRKTANGLKIKGGKLAAAVNYLGADSNNRGYYYGFCANPVDLEADGGTPADREDTPLLVFDFGPPSGSVAPDALAINGTSGHPSFHWLKKPSKYVNGFRKSLDPLMMDWAEIKPQKYAEMEIKVKPGKYQVTVGTGGANTMCWLHQFYRPMQAEILVNGEKKWSFNEQDETRFSLMNREVRMTDDIYDIYIAPHLKDLTAQADCPDGKLRIKITAGQKNVPLNYVAVYPVEDKTAAARLKRMISIRRKIIQEFWQDVTPSEKELFTPLCIKEYIPKGKDFAVFARNNPYEYIFFKTRPLISEENAPLRILTAPGQYAVGTALLHTFAPLKNAGVRLILPDFPKAAVSYIMPYRFASYNSRRYFIAPNHYVPMGKRDLEKDQSYGFRVCFRTPDELNKGLYRGQLEFSGNGQKVLLPLEIRVTGEKLPELTDHLIAMVGIGQAENLYNGLLFCRENLGCTTALINYGRSRDAKFKTDDQGMPVEVIRNKDVLIKWFELYKQVKFPCKTPFLHMTAAPNRMEQYRQGPFKIYTKEYEKAFKLQMEYALDIAKKHGNCTGLIADLGGEMGHGNNFPKQEVMDAAIEVFKQVARTPGFVPSYRCNCSETTRQFYPHLHIQGVRGPGSWPVSDQQSSYGKNKHLYTYSVSGRFANGLHSWAHGAKGNLREFLVFKHQIEYNDFLACCGYCGGTYHFEAMPAPNGELLPTIRSDAFRSAVIDRQYLRMLENAMEKSQNSKAKEKASAFISILRNRAYAWKEESNTWMLANNPWPGIRLDLMREIVVMLCEELNSGKTLLPQFSHMPKISARPIPAEPKLKDIMKDLKVLQNLPYKHWRNIRTGQSWEKQGLPYDGCAWYRKKIRIPSGWDTPVLRIGAADEQAWVFCNGKYLGHHNGWNEPFQFALNNVKAGNDAEIAIMVYDSMAMGGIWRSVTLHKNMQDAQNGHAGINEDANWKIALKPEGQNLDIFEFTDGPLVPENSDLVEAKIMLIPETYAKLQKLTESKTQFVIQNLQGKELHRENLGAVSPYAAGKYVISLKGIQESVCDAVLIVAGKEFARFRFYRIPFWKP